MINARAAVKAEVAGEESEPCGRSQPGQSGGGCRMKGKQEAGRHP